MVSESADVSGGLPTTGVVVDASEPHKANLLEQFYLTLRATYLAALTQSLDPPAAVSDIRSQIVRLFGASHSWQNAYEIEQLLCFVLSEGQLVTELNRRLAEARAMKLEQVAVIEQALQETTMLPHGRRIVLHRLLNDLQWFYSKRVQHRAASKKLMVRVSRLFIAALVLFALVLFVQFFAHGSTNARGSEVPRAVAASDAGPSTGEGRAEAGPSGRQVGQGLAATPNGATAPPVPVQSAEDNPNGGGSK